MKSAFILPGLRRRQIGTYGLVVALLGPHVVAACGSDDSSPPPSVDGANGDAPVEVDAGPFDDAPQDVVIEAERSEDARETESELGCSQMTFGPVGAASAKSAGWGGSEQAYYALYDATCSAAGDCAAACVAAGGENDSCTSGSDCIASLDDAGSTCLPPVYWLNVAGALSASGTTTGAAELVLVNNPYDDALVLTHFGVSVPQDATILGIQFDVRCNADDGMAVDDAVRVVQDGALSGTDHGQASAWPMNLTYVTYGGPNDLWGASWTPAGVSSDGFGLSIAPRYTGSGGNDRAHIDSVKVTVYYAAGCGQSP